MSEKRKHKPASETAIKLGDLIEDLPDDFYEAGQALSRFMNDSQKWGLFRARDFARHVCDVALLQLVQEDVIVRARISGRGPKGPRLPTGVTFIQLVIHLSEAARIQASKEVPFDAWCESHEWPGYMKVKGNTARTWLKRYAKYIAAFDELKVRSLK